MTQDARICDPRCVTFLHSNQGGSNKLLRIITFSVEKASDEKKRLLGFRGASPGIRFPDVSLSGIRHFA